MRLPKPTPLGWCAAAAIAVVGGTIGFVVLHSPIVAGLLAVLGGSAFVLAGPRPAPSETMPAPAPPPAVVPAPRAEAIAAPQPMAMAVPVAPVGQFAPVPSVAPVASVAPDMPEVPAEPAMLFAPPEPAAPALLADPLGQVSLLSAYLQDETGGYQPSYAPQAPTLVARVPGQTLTVTEPDPLADAFSGPIPESPVEMPPAGSWRMGVDILPQSRSSAVAVGDRLASFRSAVLKARRETKPKPENAQQSQKAPKPQKPPPGKHRAV